MPAGRATQRHTLRVDIIGGYRIVRRLGAGERAEVFLGYSASAGNSRGATAAIKLFRPGVDRYSIDQEVAVLAATDSRHLLRLEDVATTDDGRQCLVLPRLPGPSLARLLAERETLAPGEVVTILVPLAQALIDLHESWCCHGALGPGSVLFDEEGAPVLARFGRATIFGDRANGVEHLSGASVASRAAEPRVGEDLRGLRAVVDTLLARTSLSGPDRRTAALLDWLREPDRESDSGTFAQELGIRMFEVATATPVLFPSAVSSAEPSWGRGRLPPGGAVSRGIGTPTSGVDARQNELVRGDVPVRGHGPATATGLRGTLLRAGERSKGAFRSGATLLGGTVRAVSAVRTRFIVAAAAGLATFVIAAVLLGSAGGRGSAGAGPRPDARPGAQFDATASEPAQAPTGEKDAVSGDDPLAALGVLLRAREHCIELLSVTCLDSVEQQGTSSHEDDSHLIRALKDGAGRPASGLSTTATFVLAERLGDSALLTTQPTADDMPLAVLLMKGESGWRIRDFPTG